MNVETGALYEGVAAIQAAEQRGEPIVRISEKAAAIVKAGHKAKSKRKMAKQSRKRNRAS